MPKPRKPAPKKTNKTTTLRKRVSGRVSSPPAGELLSTFQELVAYVIENPIAGNIDMLAEAASEMERRFATLRQRAQTAAAGVRAKEKLQDEESAAYLRAALPNLLEAVTPAPEFDLPFAFSMPVARPFKAGTDGNGASAGIDLGGFFSQVVDALIAAQKNLDLASLQYALQRAGTSIPPMLFSIPKVQAEVKVGFTQKGEKGINIILVKDTTSQTSYGESTINFDVVASPPPPGPIERMLAPVPDFLVAGPKRDELLKVVQTAVAIQYAADWSSRAVAIRLPKPADAPQPYLVLAFDVDTSKQVSILSAHVADGKVASSYTNSTRTPDLLQADLKAVEDTIQGWFRSITV